MTTSATTNDVTFDPATVLRELGLPPTATVRDLLRAGAARVVLGHLADLLERADLVKFTHLELPPSSWSFHGPLPNLDEIEEAVEGADWRNADSATARQLCDAAMFELWQASPHLARAVGLVAASQRQTVREHNAERGVA